MKIAVASTGYSLDSDVSPIFGRSSAFVIVEMDKSNITSTSIIKNPATTRSGNTAAYFLTNQGIKVLISGKLGPVAFHTLKNAGIKVYKATSKSVEGNLKRFMEGKLEEVTSLSGGFPV